MGGADISGDNTGDIMGNSRARGEPFGRAPRSARSVAAGDRTFRRRCTPQWLRLLISATLILLLSHAGGDYRSQQGRHFLGRETVRAQFLPFGGGG